MAEQPYNPLDKRRLGESVALALLKRPVVDLPPAPFSGAGVYALYYLGDFPAYKKIVAQNENEQWAAPIYVGKAVPPGARKGGYDLEENPRDVLHHRLKEHADTIEKATNLKLEDFRCRFLLVDDIWIPLGEALLITMYMPLWNRLLDGFGNHDPGSGRYNQQCSPWDVVHPGRAWAAKLKPNPRSVDEFMADIEAFLLKAKT